VPEGRARLIGRLAAVVIVAGALGAPATVASSAVARPARCPTGAKGAVIDAYMTVFSRIQVTTADERAARLAGGDDPTLRALLDDWLADPAGANSTVTVEKVRCLGRARAIVDADLVLAGTRLADVLPPGRARREDGVWKVARATFCARVILEDPARARSGPCARR
jgi:hypothetical protein